MNAYITNTAIFLPNAPVGNEQMEQVLGVIGHVPSRIRRIILRNNKIKKRYYAINPQNGETTHSNAQMAAESVRSLEIDGGFSIDFIDCLCCGTSAPDQLMPGHASMVHGELGRGRFELISTAGICLSGITALKYGAMGVALGEYQNAVATGSEQASSFMRGRFCESIDIKRLEALEKQPVLSFEADFLRWMLSDGAGAVLINNKPDPSKLNLKIEWIEMVSHADELETCMYAGGIKSNSGQIKGWREFDSVREAERQGAFLVRQDAKLLNKKVIPTLVDRSLPKIIEKHGLKSEEIDWFLPHYSSDYFKNILHDHLVDIGFNLPFNRWFTNLEQKGNTGSASFYIILDEFLKSDRPKKGDRVFCFIPESGRFSVGYILFTVV